MEAVASLGYVPNQSARSLRRQKTERVCLFLNSIGIPYNDMLANELDKTAYQNGYSMILAIGGSMEQEHRVFDQLMRGLADGVIIVGNNYLTDDEVSLLASSGCAVVVSDNYLAPAGVDLIQNTEREASLLAMQYLYSKGHRRIGYIGNVSGTRSQLPRYESYRQFMLEQQITVPSDYVQQDKGISRENAYACAQNLLKCAQVPTAVFCGSDLAAISAISACRSAGKRVPEDIAVIGAGNIPEGQITLPALTTIGPPQLDFSQMVQMLFSRLRGEAPVEGRKYRIQWDLVLRNSA